MRKLIYSRPMNIVLPQEMFIKVKTITDQLESTYSKWVRDLIQREIDRLEKGTSIEEEELEIRKQDLKERVEKLKEHGVSITLGDEEDDNNK